jgi:phage-related protein
LVDPTEQAKIINEQAKRVVNGLIKMWRDFWKWVTKMWQKSFVEPIQMVFMWFKKFFDEFFKIVGMFVSAMGTFIENIKNMISALWDIIASIGTAIWNAFLTVIEEINRILKPIFDAFTSAANSLGEGIKEFVDGLTEFVEDLPTKVTEAFQGVYDFFDVDLSMDVESAFKPVYDFFNGIPNLFTQAGNNLANGAKSIFEGLTRVFSNLDPTSLGNRLGDAIGAGLNNTIKQPINKLIDIINGMVIPKVDYSISAGRLGSWSGQLFPAIDLIPGNIPRLADGGPIGGSFDGTDNQLIAAMPGEFVLNRSAVASLGQDNVAAMNRTGQIPKSGSTTNNSINIEPGAIVVSQIAGEDSEQLANRIIEMLKERSAAGQTVIFESGVRAS